LTGDVVATSLTLASQSRPCTYGPYGKRAGGLPGGTEVPPGRRSAHRGWTVRDGGSSTPLASPRRLRGAWAAYRPHPGVAGPTEVISIRRVAHHGPRGAWTDPERRCRPGRGRRWSRAWSL